MICMVKELNLFLWDFYLALNVIFDVADKGWAWKARGCDKKVTTHCGSDANNRVFARFFWFC